MWSSPISLFLLLFQAPFSTFGIFLQSKSDLKCYDSYQSMPIGKNFIDNATTVTHSKHGFCVNIRTFNDSHQTSIKAFWEAAKVPLECHYYGTHCWGLNEGEDAACCCAKDLCNENDDVVSLIYPNSYYPSMWFRPVVLLRALLLFLTTQTIPVWLTILGTFVFHRILRLFNQEVPQTVFEDPMETTTIPLEKEDSTDTSDFSFKRTDMSQRRKMQKAASILRTPKPESQPLLTPKNDSNRQLNVKSSRLKTAKPEAKNEEIRARSKEGVADKAPPERSSPREEDTQPSERKAPSPVKGIQQEKPPTVIILPNGRVQKVSMNFEEGDEEWDEQ